MLFESRLVFGSLSFVCASSLRCTTDSSLENSFYAADAQTVASHTLPLPCVSAGRDDKFPSHVRLQC